MDRRRFLNAMGRLAVCGTVAQTFGCRHNQTAHVLNETDRDMVGSHAGGAETWEPLVQRSVSQLLGRQMTDIQQVSHDGSPCKKRICFVGVQNKGGEDLGDWGNQINEEIDTAVNQSGVFEVINRHAVEEGLRECRLRPDQLYVKKNQREFLGVMEQAGQLFDYYLYAIITTGTTKSNSKDMQRDYLLTLELVNVETYSTDKVSEKLRKGYHKSKLGQLKHYGTTS